MPFFLTHWPILVLKPVDRRSAIALLRRCHIDVRGGSFWLSMFSSGTWLYVPRHQAHRAEATLKRYGYRIGAKNLT